MMADAPTLKMPLEEEGSRWIGQIHRGGWSGKWSIRRAFRPNSLLFRAIMAPPWLSCFRVPSSFRGKIIGG